MSEETKNLTFKISPATRALIEKLRDESDAASITEVVRRAVEVHAFIAQAIAEGSTLSFRDKNGNERSVIIL